MRTSGIESEPTATGERFVLPERNVPHRRGIGLAITGGASFIALLGTGFGVTWILMAFPTTRGGPPSPLGYAVAAIGLVPIVLSLAVGWKFARLGLLIAFGRAEVRVERGTIIATDRFGPVAWTRRIARSEIERFEIRSKLTDERGGPDSTTANGPWRDTLVLVARRAQPEGGSHVLATNSSAELRCLVHGARRVAHQVRARLRLRERDHVADVVGPREVHHEPVEPERDPAVRRRAVAERLEQEAELRVRLGLAHPEQVEDLLLDVLPVDTDRPAADLGAVDDHVVPELRIASTASTSPLSTAMNASSLVRASAR
jgi:hypothetical protein